MTNEELSQYQSADPATEIFCYHMDAIYVSSMALQEVRLSFPLDGGVTMHGRWFMCNDLTVNTVIYQHISHVETSYEAAVELGVLARVTGRRQ